jgi:hypothetical protein
VLRASGSPADRTEAVRVAIPPDGPRLLVVDSRPGDGPFGPLVLRRLAPPPIVMSWRVARGRGHFWTPAATSRSRRDGNRDDPPPRIEDSSPVVPKSAAERPRTPFALPDAPARARLGP